MIFLTLVALGQLAVIVWLLLDRRTERREGGREREMLLQRIQAPEVAIQAHALQQPVPPSPLPLGLEDDEAWNLSREEMAEALNRGDE